MGSLINRNHLGKPKEAFSLLYIYKLAGKTTISSTIMPHAANDERYGTQSNTPNIISAAPLIILIVFGAGSTGGIIFIYKRGTLKWLIPARIYKKAMRYNE